MQRRFPRPRELRSLLRMRRIEWRPQSRRLVRAHTIADLRAAAARCTPRAAFDFADGAAEQEISLGRARQAFEDITFHPQILKDVSSVDLSVDLFGTRSALPFGIAPTGSTRLMHSAGERAGAAAAGRAGIPFGLSTMGNTSIEDVAAASPDGRHWFQLYVWKDRARSMALVDRAAAAGYESLVITVDVPVTGARHRDTRNGLTLPPNLTVRTLLNALPRPGWWINFLTTEPISFSSLAASPDDDLSDIVGTMFDATVGIEDLAWLREQWSGNFIVKGVQTLEDAIALSELGVDAIVLSNHGGRQLDRTEPPFHLLPRVAERIGADTVVMVDTGIMSGADIVACLALGAKFTLIGRAYLYGLMAGGEKGVDRSIEILRTEIERAMRLLGVSSIAELNPSHVTQLRRLIPYVRQPPDRGERS